MQTGFRRHIYQVPRPPLSKELRLSIKKDRLRYPWDYTKDNLYRPPRWVDKSPKEILMEHVEGDPYPIHDPFGLYRDRPKKERKAIEDGPSIREELMKLSPRQILAKAIAKAYTKADQRDPMDDIDDMLREFSRPLPRSQVVDYLPSTGDLFDFQISYDDGKGLDAETVKKIQAGRTDIAEFERKLDARQKERLRRPLVALAVQRPQDMPEDGIKAEVIACQVWRPCASSCDLLCPFCLPPTSTHLLRRAHSGKDQSLSMNIQGNFPSPFHTLSLLLNKNEKNTR